ncbi:MAG: hypothetical protein D6731_13990 [Planctomycetota bacterium]|nr:MAG: hypothetical protein D6731_13990 [Planctomycetota bacterium]
MTSRGKRLLAVAATALLAGGASEAGVVVLRDGSVLVGRLRPRDVQPTRLVLHEPDGAPGSIAIERARVRWFDPKADTLTDDYFRAHPSAPLRGRRWIDLRERWLARERDRRRWELDPPLWVGVDAAALDPVPVAGPGFRLRKPAGWNARLQDGILVLEAPRRDATGYRPRIHVFSAPAASASPAAQVEWIHQELLRVAGRPGRFEVLELHRPRAHAAGSDQRLLTETRTELRTLHALRQVCFRSHRTVLFAAYADARSFSRHQARFEASLATLEADD